MQAYGAGTASAFDTLYARHKGGVYRYLLRHCRDAAVADELFQDVWMNAIRVRASYSPTAKFTTWLYTLAHNRLVDHWRATGRVRLVSVDDEDGEAVDVVAQLPADAHHEPQARAASRELGAQLAAALQALPAEQRDAFLLQYEGGLSLAEIAQATGVGLETAKSRLRYALTKLRGALGPLHDEWRVG
jgi:RNA polymerase sigma-70 factor (ECF subfamily)